MYIINKIIMSAILLLQIVRNQNLVKRFRREQTYSNLHENSTPTKFFIKTFDPRHALSLVSDCFRTNFEAKVILIPILSS